MEVLNTLKTRDEGTKQTAAAVCKLQTHSPPKTCYFTENKMFCFPLCIWTCKQGRNAMHCSQLPVLISVWLHFWTCKHLIEHITEQFSSSPLSPSPSPHPPPPGRARFPKVQNQLLPWQVPRPKHFSTLPPIKNPRKRGQIDFIGWHLHLAAIKTLHLGRKKTNRASWSSSPNTHKDTREAAE